jgi:hypothetical protein
MTSPDASGARTPSSTWHGPSGPRTTRRPPGGLRPGFVFKEEPPTEQHRLFAGPLLPGRLGRPRSVPVVPDIPGPRFRAPHTDDAADACAKAVFRPEHGAFNLSAEPVVDAGVLAGILGAPRRTASACRRARHRGRRLAPASGPGLPAPLRRGGAVSDHGHHPGPERTPPASPVLRRWGDRGVPARPTARRGDGHRPLAPRMPGPAAPGLGPCRRGQA